MSELKSHFVWDASTRWFHWINVLCVIALAGLGLVIINAGAMEIPNKGKLMLKTWHVWVGYVFAINLAWRFVWAFIGNRHARWREMLPGGRGYWQSLKTQLAGLRIREPLRYLGHTPSGRIGVAVLLLLMLIQALTGLVLAGTDLFYPPIGAFIARWVAAPGTDPSTLVAYAPGLYDKTAYADMRSWREPVAVIHVYNFYVLMLAVVLHIGAVVMTELREGGGIITAMVTGRKVLTAVPLDGASRK